MTYTVAMNLPFTAFDPLEVKSKLENSLAAQRAVRREIENILSSYVGWYDPFCELVQNGLDAGKAGTRRRAGGNKRQLFTTPARHC